ncbi:hypothetical protein AgCh_027720 [Apium graveolens]
MEAVILSMLILPYELRHLVGMTSLPKKCPIKDKFGRTLALLEKLIKSSAQEALDELIQDYAFRAFVEVGVILGMALVSMYAKNGAILLVWKCFDGMLEKNIATWNAMICGLAAHGYAKEAISLFGELKKRVLSSTKLYNYTSVLPLKVVVSSDFGLDEQEEDGDGGVDERSFCPDLKIFVGNLQERMGEQLKIGLKIVSWVELGLPESDRNPARYFFLNLKICTYDGCSSHIPS